MRKATLWLLACALLIAPLAFAANDKDNDKKSSDTAKTSAGDAAKPDAKPANSAPSNAEVIAELEQMRVLMKEQSDQIAQQQRQLAAMQAKLDAANTAANAPAPPVNSSITPASNAAASNAIGETAAMNPSPSPVPSRQDTERKDSPLSFRIGAAEFTPGGFVDFENVFRSTNTGNAISTNFFNIPFSNQVQGHLTEYRASGQNSRFNLQTNAKFGKNDVTGYLEFDFNGNDAANTFVTANSHTNRLRLYWLDLKRGKWEFLGGQTWGLETPNRVGVSPAPKDLFVDFVEDANQHVGLNYTRAAEFRAAYHFNDHWVWAGAIQNPQQFTNGEVIFPAQFNAQLGVQTDNGSNTGTPNIAPDVITKVAYDGELRGQHFHVEGGGLMTTVKITDLNTATFSFTGHSSVGGGVLGAFNIDLTPNFRVVGNALWGNGVGRYLIGLGPQFVVDPIQIGPTAFDLHTSMVHAGDALLGVEATYHKSQFGFYYGGAYFQRNFTCDPTSAGTGSCGLSGKPFIGFGYPGSSNSSNKSIQEGTITWTQNLMGTERHGSLLLINQASYLTRAPWFVPNGAPKNAHLMMAFVSLRYVLP